MRVKVLKFWSSVHPPGDSPTMVFVAKELFPRPAESMPEIAISFFSSFEGPYLDINVVESMAIASFQNGKVVRTPLVEGDFVSSIEAYMDEVYPESMFWELDCEFLADKDI